MHKTNTAEGEERMEELNQETTVQTSSAPKEKGAKRKTLRKRPRSGSWQLYVMIAVPIAFIILFSYVPMAGIRLAFVEKFYVKKGIWGSPWGGLKWFKEMMLIPDIWQIIGNTLAIACMKVFIGFPIPVIVSLLLNEMHSKWQKKTIQTLIYLPYFLSWVVLGNIIFQMFGSQGSVTLLFARMGIKLDVFTNGNQFVTMIVASDLWKGFGFSTVVYLASLTNIDKGLYEAAEIDGAGRFKQTIHITIPGIMPIVMLNAILNLGNVLNAGFEQILVLYNPFVYDKAEIIDTIVYKMGILQNQEELSTAIGLTKGLINAVLVIGVNVVSTKVTDYRVF